MIVQFVRHPASPAPETQPLRATYHCGERSSSMAARRSTCMRPPLRSVFALIGFPVVFGSSACASSSNPSPANAPSRSATDVPERFLVGTISPGGTLSEPQPNSGCRNPMVDPRDGTRLTLVQSQPGGGTQIGDYAVPEGRYGARAGEVLRIDCGTGRVIGLVLRRA